MAGISGAGSGAVSGASAGSALGPYGAAAGALVGGAAGFFGGGGSSQSSGYTLPPEYEIQFFQQFQQNMQDLQRSYQQVSNLSNIYNQRMDASYKAMQGTIPSAEATKFLTASGMQIAQSMGLDPSQLVKQGLLQPGEHTSLQKIYDIANNGGYAKDAVTENKIQEQKRQLQQSISSLPASQQAIAMQQFENNSNIMRQQAGQQQIQQLTGYLGAAQGSLGAIQGQLGFAQQGIQGLAGLAGNQLQGNLQGQQVRQGLRGEALGNYQTMGQFQFSDAANAGLSSGLFGSMGIAPGSFGQQTGIAQSALGDYNNWVQTQERLNTTGQAQNGYVVGNQDRSVQGYQAFKQYQQNQNAANLAEINKQVNYQGNVGAGGTNYAANRGLVRYT